MELELQRNSLLHEEWQEHVGKEREKDYEIGRKFHEGF